MKPLLDPKIFQGQPLPIKGNTWKIGGFEFDDSVILNRALWQTFEAFDTTLYEKKTLIVGQKYSGKSLLLLKSIIHFSQKNIKVFVLDPCVEEGGVSLINILLEGGIPQKDVYWNSIDAQALNIANIDKMRRRYSELQTTQSLLGISFSNPINLLDVSFLLERSHDAVGNTKRRLKTRYFLLLQQVLLELYYFSVNNEQTIALILDEIRLPLNLVRCLHLFPQENLKLIAAVHDDRYITNPSMIFSSCIYLSTPTYVDGVANSSIRFENLS